MDTNEILQKLLDVLNEKADKTKDVDPYNTATRLHGQGGLFSAQGIERDVISTHLRPYGLGDILPKFASVLENPVYATLTGFGPASGNQPAYACQDAPTGYMKGCKRIARFGMLRFDTNTIEMDKVMLRLNRGDMTDLQLRGKILGAEDVFGAGAPSEGDVLNIMTASEMITTGVLFQRELNRQLWQGNMSIANEFAGLDYLIATGYKDYETEVLCPSLDSDVKNYNLAELSSTIVEYMSYVEAYVRNIADNTGLSPATWVWVMRPELWYELSAIWPCAYNTNKCGGAVGENGIVYVDGRENVSERDAMRNGLYIDVNGNRYKVVLDTGIYEKNSTNSSGLAAGEFASTIYFVPLMISGNMPVLYREYVDYRRAMPDVSLLKGKETFFWTDAGIYSWALEQEKWCYKLAAKTEQRVILLTPQLAGRIDNVKYTPLQHLRTPHPSDPYFVDGGNRYAT